MSTSASAITTNAIAQIALYKQTGGGGGGGTNVIVLPMANWFIDSVHGSNTNPGTHSKPLKTWSEFQRRIGFGTEIATPQPGSPILLVTLLNDLPENDPITFNNVMAPGFTALVQGQTKILKTGTIAALGVQVDSTGTVPGTSVFGAVTAPGLGQAQVGKQIQITAGTGVGSRAMVGRDIGGGKVQVTEWCTGNSANGDAYTGIVYGMTPAPGDHYQIVDFTTAYMGECFVGFDASSLPAFGIGFGGLSFQQMHFPPTANGPFETQVPFTDTNFLTITDFADCIFDQSLTVGQDNNFVGITCCSIRGDLTVESGSQVTLQFGGVIPLRMSEGGTDTSFTTFNPGSQYVYDGNYAFIGPVTPDPTLDFPQGAVLVSNGAIGTFYASVSFWNSNFPCDISGGATIAFGFSPTFSISNVVPMYGDGNALPFNLDGGEFIIQTGDGTNPSPILPTVNFPLIVGAPVSPALTADIAWLFGPSLSQVAGPATNDLGSRSLPFDIHAAIYTAPLRKNTWANLAVSIAGGGFQGDVVPIGFFPGHSAGSSSQRPDSPLTAVMGALLQFV